MKLTEVQAPFLIQEFTVQFVWVNCTGFKVSAANTADLLTTMSASLISLPLTLLSAFKGHSVFVIILHGSRWNMDVTRWFVKQLNILGKFDNTRLPRADNVTLHSVTAIKADDVILFSLKIKNKKWKIKKHLLIYGPARLSEIHNIKSWKMEMCSMSSWGTQKYTTFCKTIRSRSWQRLHWQIYGY